MIDSFFVAQADLENARNFLSKAAEQNLVCSILLLDHNSLFALARITQTTF